MKANIYIILSFVLLALGACSSKPPQDVVSVDVLPDIYPDYVDVTVPVNIAPLNFILREDCEDMYVTATAADTEITADCRGNEATFSVRSWKKLLEKAVNTQITIDVYAKRAGKWMQYLPFNINVVSDSIDPYLTYRLIEPDYEVFSRLQIMERCVEDFSERPLCDYNMVGNRCMNCHTYGSNRGDLSFMYVRGDGGGMILNRDGVLSKLTLKTDDMVSGSVYAQFSPSGDYIAFSSNVIIPAFHSDPTKRLEVFDTKSDVYVADLRGDRILRSPLTSDSLRLETFPAFSPDGKSLYYCVSDALKSVRDIDSLQYSLCRIAFDETTGTFGTEVDTIVCATAGQKRSVSHPRISPDGRYLLYTVADYGTFPIWHPEADLQMLDLTTGAINNLETVNSDKSDTYHSWSSSGRWFVFASKRDDGLYGKPYFCHVSEDGTVSKPFVLPQRYPDHYDNTLKSYNVPELGRARVKFNAADIKDALGQPAVSPR